MNMQVAAQPQPQLPPLLRDWSPSRNASGQPSLTVSDYWFLAGLLLTLFYVTDPWYSHLDKISITKHLPLMISMCGVLMANIGNWLFRPRNRAPIRHWQVLSAGLPLILLGMWIVAGSLYAVKIEHVHNSFITVGIYMLFTFLTARLVMLSPARARIVRIYLTIAACFAVFMVLRMAVNFGDPVVPYHELEALVVPLAVYFALRPSNNQYWKAFMTLFFLVAGLVFRKNTGFLMIPLTLLYLWIVEWRFRFRESAVFRIWTMFWVVVIFVAGVAATGYLAHQRSEMMPSGNPGYRMLTYEVAIHRFYDSPVWGTGFTHPASEKFKAYIINVADGVLPTHSDILDLAAQGGVIALSLWLWGYLRIMSLSARHSLAGRPYDDMRAAAHALACMSLTSIVVYAFNPIMLQPGKGLLLWSQFGMLLGITLHLASNPSPATSTKAKK
jgi:hypothetical protein